MAKEVTVFEAGFILQLQEHLGQSVDGQPLWSSQFIRSHPQAVLQTHLDLLRGGADAFETNTYQANVDGIMTIMGLTEEDSLEYIREAVEIAKKAREQYLEENPTVTKKPLILGSCGPYGTCLRDFSEYTGDYIDTVSEQQLKDWHRPRIRVMVEAGVDILALETIPALEEALALLQLLKEFPQAKAWISFSVRDEQHISRGQRFQEAARRCWDSSSQLVAVGVNCVQPRLVSSLLRGVNDDRPQAPIPLVVYPNSGEKYDAKMSEWVDREKTRPIEDYVMEWLDLGVKFIGGCCRTEVGDIQKIKKVVEEWQKKSNSGC